jgi:hypothetical protein
MDDINCYAVTNDSPYSPEPSFVFEKLFVCVLVTSVTSGKFVAEGTLIQQPLIVCKFVDKKICDIFHVRLCSICMCNRGASPAQ